MTKDQEYQVSVCARELQDGATVEELMAKGYASGAVHKAAERVSK